MNVQDSLVEPEISAEKANRLKAVALIMMFWHHLFGCELINGWSAIIPGTEGFAYVIGTSCKICIGMFLFCSGYGLYKTYIDKEKAPDKYVLRRLVKIFIPYWLIMIFAIAYLIITRKFEPEYLLINTFVLYIYDGKLYVSFAWFILIYYSHILLLPLVRKIERNKKGNVFIDIVLYVLIPFTVSMVLSFVKISEVMQNAPVNILENIETAVLWFPLFAYGMLFAKYKTYERVRKHTDKHPRILIVFLCLLIIGNILYLRYYIDSFFIGSGIYGGWLSDIIFMPVFICSVFLVLDYIRFKSRHLMPFLGKRAIYYWLLSSMFFLNTSELQFLITWPRITVLILIWTFIILTPFVFGFSYVSDKLIKVVSGILFQRGNKQG